MNTAAWKGVSAVMAIAAMLSFAAQAQTAPAAEGAKPPVPMQERMKIMHEQMERISSAKDPDERQKLAQEHLQDCMQMMSGTMGAMHGGQGGGHGTSNGGHHGH